MCTELGPPERMMALGLAALIRSCNMRVVDSKDGILQLDVGGYMFCTACPKLAVCHLHVVLPAAGMSSFTWLC